MRWRITGMQTPGEAGWFAQIQLFFDDLNEHVTIKENKCRGMDLIQGTPHTFARVYDQIDHFALIPVDSSTQTDIFIGMLDKGLREVDALIKRAARTKPRTAPLPPPTWDSFDTDARFEHTWVIGESGWGKTSLLSALIVNDLFKVRDGKASVLIIDSQEDRLTNYLPHMEDFGPGGDLHGKLIYLEPDPEHPLALNIFDFENYHRLSKGQQLAARETAQEMLMFFIGATVGIPSGHMTNIIGYALRALVHIPNATVFTFRELLTQGRLKKWMAKKEYAALRTLDDETKAFLLTDMFSSNYAPSVGAMVARLNAFGQHDYLRECFRQPRNKVDLFTLLKEPRVIVVDTKESMLRANMPIFGRYFIALLLGVVRSRNGGGLPCYVHIDEAWQYIAEEPIVADLIATARKQNIALTFAQQFRSRITNTVVNKALQTCAIQIDAAKQKYHWHVRVGKDEQRDITPPYIDFKKQPQMAPHHWRNIIDDMHARFSVKPPRHAPTPPEEMPDAV